MSYRFAFNREGFTTETLRALRSSGRKASQGQPARADGHASVWIPPALVGGAACGPWALRALRSKVGGVGTEPSVPLGKGSVFISVGSVTPW